MKRILFVDDDRRLVAGLKRLFHGKRELWDVTTCSDPVAAVALVQQQPFDLVISDMRMPVMDGAALLDEVKRLRPSVLRVVLTGQCDVSASQRAMHVAHQFLVKPLDGDRLIEAVQRLFFVQETVGEAELRQVVGGVTALPSAPQVYRQLHVAMADPAADTDRLAGIVRSDVALCAKILQMVNSSFFGIGRPIADLRQAVSFLGMETLKQVVLSVECFDSMREGNPGPFLEEQQRHAVLTARIAAEVVGEPRHRDQNFTAALLHDLGRILIAQHLPDHDRQIERIAALPCLERRLDPEASRLLDMHCRVGAYLLGIWGLPAEIVESVLFHHRPSAVADDRFGPVGVVHVADCLASILQNPSGAPGDEALRAVDLEWLERVGVAERLDDWFERAAALFAKASGGATKGSG